MTPARRIAAAGSAWRSPTPGASSAAAPALIARRRLGAGHGRLVARDGGSIARFHVHSTQVRSRSLGAA